MFERITRLFDRNKKLVNVPTAPGAIPVQEVKLIYEDVDLGQTFVLYQAPDEETAAKARAVEGIMQKLVKEQKNRPYHAKGNDEAKPTLTRLLAKAEKELGLVRQDGLDENGKVIPAYRHYHGLSLSFKTGEMNRYYHCYCAHYQDGQRSKLYGLANAYEVNTDEYHFEENHVTDVYNLPNNDLDRDITDVIFWRDCDTVESDVMARFKITYAEDRTPEQAGNIRREVLVSTAYKKLVA